MTTDPNPSPEAAPAARPLWLSLLLWTCKFGAAGILGYAGYLKLTSNPADRELFETLGMEPFGRYLIGGLECSAAGLILIRQSAVYGAFLGLGVMCGAIIGHLTVLGPAHIEGAILVAVLCLVILYVRRRDAPFIGNMIDW